MNYSQLVITDLHKEPTDLRKEPIVKNITEEQRQQIISIIADYPKDQQTNSYSPKFRYDELDTHKGRKAIFCVSIKSSNEDPNFKSTDHLFKESKDAEMVYRINQDIGTSVALYVFYIQIDVSQVTERTLEEWNQYAPEKYCIYTKTNRGIKITSNHTVFVFDMDNQIIDIRPPFLSEQYEDDLIDWTGCFERHLMSMTNNQDRIRYALEECGVKPDTPEYEVSKVTIYHNLILRNFPK